MPLSSLLKRALRRVQKVKMRLLASIPPLAAYIHWPFCASICPYCDFNVHLVRGARQNIGQDIDVPRWLAAYEKEVTYQARLTPSREIETVFFGGGTPSLMPPVLVAGILSALDKNFGLAANVEVSLEANPVSVSREGLRALKAAGVTRLSLGVQSLDDAALKFLGRTHRADQAIAAFEDVISVFETASFDLIYARPSQTVDDWADELRRALSLSPPHLSAYQLTLEPGTPFYRLFEAGKLTPPDEDVQVALFETTRALCADAGLVQYEVSNYARANHQCRHNMASWRGADYLGVGPGAHGRLTAPNNKRCAIMGIKKPQDWLTSIDSFEHGLEVNEVMTQESCLDEAVLFGLRLVEGVSMDWLQQLGFTPEAEKMALKISMLQQEGLIEQNKNVLKATPKGQLVLDALGTTLLI